MAVINNELQEVTGVPDGVEIDCMHWLLPSSAVSDGVDVPHWLIDQRGEDE